MTWTEVKKRTPGTEARWKIACASVLLSVGLTGCGGALNNNDSIPASSQVNSYVGTQDSVEQGGVYGMTVDHNTNYFDFSDQSHEGSPVSYIGNFTKAADFQELNVTYTTDPQFAANPSPLPIYLLEVPGDAALLESSYQLPLVVFAGSKSCQPFTGPTTFQFIQLGSYFSGSGALQGYGTVSANPAGSNWSFSNFDLLQMDGVDEKPAQLSNGACGYGPEGYVTTIPAMLGGQPIVYSVAISPNGYFIMDRDKTFFTATSTSEALAPLAGVAQPGSPLDTKSVVTAGYAGFELDDTFSSPQVAGNSEPLTLPVLFSSANAKGGKMVGGIFPSGDPTQTPGADIEIDLGTQDPSHNGLYPSIAVTLPDNKGICVGTPYAGSGPSGNPTCIFSGQAVAGNPNGKYALFITLSNPVGKFGTSAIQFLLYQQ